MRHPYRDLRGLLILPMVAIAVLITLAGLAGHVLPTIGAIP